jgi:hypothetical protein
MIAPPRICRGASAAGIGAVDDVVVNQRGAVEKLDDGRESDGTVTGTAGVSRGEKKQCRAQAFSAAAEEVAGNFRHRLKSGRALSGQFLFDEDEIISDEIENFPGCEQRDGRPPGRKTNSNKMKGRCETIVAA